MPKNGQAKPARPTTKAGQPKPVKRFALRIGDGRPPSNCDCGTPIEPGDKFCRQCGARIKSVGDGLPAMISLLRHCREMRAHNHSKARSLKLKYEAEKEAREAEIKEINQPGRRRRLERTKAARMEIENAKTLWLNAQDSTTKWELYAEGLHALLTRDEELRKHPDVVRVAQQGFLWDVAATDD